MSDALIAAVAAFGVSEATGVTNVTGLGSSDEDDDDTTVIGGSGGGNPMAGLAEAFGAVADIGERAGRGAAVIDTASSLDPSETGETVVNVLDTAGDGVRDGFGDRVDRGTPPVIDNIRDDRGSDGPGVLEVLADPEPYVQDTSESYGGAAASVPMGFMEGLWSRSQSTGIDGRQRLQELTGIEPQDTGINDDKPGVGVTDVLSAVAAGEQGDAEETYSPSEIPGAAYADLKDRVSDYEEDRPKSLYERGRDLVSDSSGSSNGSSSDDSSGSSSIDSIGRTFGRGGSDTDSDDSSGSSDTTSYYQTARDRQTGDDQPGGGGSAAEDEEEELDIPMAGSGGRFGSGSRGGTIQ